MDDNSWDELAAAAQTGDKNAYKRLLGGIIPYIRAIIVPGLANVDWADDIVQEVLISVHKSLKTYDSALSFKPWLTAIVKFRRVDFLRCHYSCRADRQVPLEDTAFIESHVTRDDIAGEWKDMEGALKRLPEQQRKVLEMVKIQGFTAQETADRTGMSVSAVKVSVHRSIKKLKAMLE